jgi:hypothetical protein
VTQGAVEPSPGGEDDGTFFLLVAVIEQVSRHGLILTAGGRRVIGVAP